MVNVLVRGRAWLIADEEQVGELVQVLEEVRLSVHADIYPDALDAPWEHELLGVGCELERQALQVRQEPMDRYNGVKSLVLHDTVWCGWRFCAILYDRVVSSTAWVLWPSVGGWAVHVRVSMRFVQTR